MSKPENELTPDERRVFQKTLLDDPVMVIHDLLCPDCDLKEVAEAALGLAGWTPRAFLVALGGHLEDPTDA